MADAPRDGNFVPSVLFESSTSPREVLPGKINETTGGVLVDVGNLSGTGAPATTPTYIGQIYVDTAGSDIYMSVGTTDANDWVAVYTAP